MVSGEIDFVEPDDKGRYHKEKFEVSDVDLSELKEIISRVAQEILDLSFWNSHCNDKKCEYCALRNMLYKKPAP